MNKVEQTGKVIWERRGNSLWVSVFVDDDVFLPPGCLLFDGRVVQDVSREPIRSSMLYFYCEARAEALKRLFPERVQRLLRKKKGKREVQRKKKPRRRIR